MIYERAGKEEKRGREGVGRSGTGRSVRAEARGVFEWGGAGAGQVLVRGGAGGVGCGGVGLGAIRVARYLTNRSGPMRS